MALDVADRTDFENADRGFVAALHPGVVRDASGRVVRDIVDALAVRVDGPKAWNERFADPDLAIVTP